MDERQPEDHLLLHFDANQFVINSMPIKFLGMHTQQQHQHSAFRMPCPQSNSFPQQEPPSDSGKHLNKMQSIREAPPQGEVNQDMEADMEAGTEAEQQAASRPAGHTAAKPQYIRKKVVSCSTDKRPTTATASSQKGKCAPGRMQSSTPKIGFRLQQTQSQMPPTSLTSKGVTQSLHQSQQAPFFVSGRAAESDQSARSVEPVSNPGPGSGKDLFQ